LPAAVPGVWGAVMGVDLERCWSVLCPVDVTDAVRWLESSPQSWPVVAANKPQRIFGIPSQLATAVQQVCGLFNQPVVVHSPMLSRIVPGTMHAMHRDNQRSDWLSRIHIPLINNDGCWLSFEEEGSRRVHFEVGNAYTFNTLKRHSFGNEGESVRIHFLFDVLRKDD